MQAIAKLRIDTLAYIDNVYGGAQDTSSATASLQKFLSKARHFEADITVSTPPTTKLKILGMIADLDNKSLSLPEDFTQDSQKRFAGFETVWRTYSSQLATQTRQPQAPALYGSSWGTWCGQ